MMGYHWLRNKCRAGGRWLSLLWKHVALLQSMRRANAPSAERAFALFRMYSHVLDKGLNIRPFEPGHSRRIYQEACAVRDVIQNRYGNPFLDDPAWQWGLTVMAEYEAAQQSGQTDNPAQVHGARLMDGLPPEAPEWIRQGIARRVSCRDLADQEIPRLVWERIVQAAVEAPTSCCRRSVRFRILHDPDRIRTASRLIAGATGYSRGIPYLICVSADLRMYADSADALLPYIDTALALDSFSLAAACEGVSVTILNFQRASLKDHACLKRLYGIPEHEQIVIFASAGYPAVLPRKPARRSVDAFLKVIP